MGLIKVQEITKMFGGLKALDHVSLEVEKGTILGIIGPNGSGKTTLLNCINGLNRPNEGTIFFKGEPITGLKPHQIARKGISRTFQIRRIFRKLSVLENMLMAVAYVKQEPEALMKKTVNLLGHVGLFPLRDNLAGELSGGQEALLEFARCLMLDPELIMLDEPFSGVHPTIKNRMIQRIKQLCTDERTFLVISHDIPTAMALCEEIMVLDKGKKVAKGTPEEIRNNDRVIEAYLG